jgi:hypothetical protein
MPGLWTGMDLYRWVAANLPGAEKNIILTISGVTDGETDSFCKQGHVPCIVKPFQVADLIAVTQSVLSRPENVAAN